MVSLRGKNGFRRVAYLRVSAVAPAQPAFSGGNGVIRTPTRRRHAGSEFLMLQNPHCCPIGWGEACELEVAAVPVGDGRVRS